MGRARRLLAALCLVLGAPLAGQAHEGERDGETLQSESALAVSQAAIGRVPGEAAFTDRTGRVLRLSELRGKPLVVTFVFTACTQSCPLILQSLDTAAAVARDALGPERFELIAVGLDPAVDTPDRLVSLLRGQGLDPAHWRLLSGDHAAVDSLAADLGFTYRPSPRGFDHLSQTSILDSRGRVAAQVYGATFASPALVEPLKAAVLGDLSALASLSDVIERVRLFCTFYDPKSERYAFDHSIFIALAVGLASLGGLAFLLLRAWIGRPRRPGLS